MSVKHEHMHVVQPFVHPDTYHAYHFHRMLLAVLHSQLGHFEIMQADLSGSSSYWRNKGGTLVQALDLQVHVIQ